MQYNPNTPKTRSDYWTSILSFQMWVVIGLLGYIAYKLF